MLVLVNDKFKQKCEIHTFTYCHHLL